MSDTHNCSVACLLVPAAAGLLESEPRLLGLLSSKSALSPLVACITPAAAAWPPLYEQASAPPSSAASDTPAAADSAAGAAGAVSSPGAADNDSSSNAVDKQALAQIAEQLAALGLQLLLRATANAAVQEALTDEVLLRQLYWLCVQPPSGRVLNAALALLRRLSSSPLAASVCGYQGGALMLLAVLLHTGRWVRGWLLGQLVGGWGVEELRRACCWTLGNLWCADAAGGAAAHWQVCESGGLVPLAGVLSCFVTLSFRHLDQPTADAACCKQSFIPSCMQCCGRV